METCTHHPQLKDWHINEFGQSDKITMRQLFSELAEEDLANSLNYTANGFM